MKKFCSKEGEITYVVKGSGPRHFLLIHNSGGNHEMMHHTADYFSRGGKVVIPDLLGHGSSASPKIDYTLNLFAESLLELCEIEKLSHVVFVGLNYGADIGIVLAQMAPTLISHLVLIEPPVFMESWIRKVVEQQMKDLEHPREAWAQETVDTVILKASAQDREIALRALKKTPAFVKISTFKHLLEWDQEGSRKQSFLCSIPTLLIQTSRPFCTEEKARSLFSNLHIGRVVGCGPWANLEVPTQVHSMIERFYDSF